MGGDWLGGGSPNAGIANGVTGTFTFKITATDAASLTPYDFIGAMNTSQLADFVVRVKGIPGPNGTTLSDKVPALVVPLPTGFAFGLAGLSGLAGLRRRR